jgi:hypothetical protein
MASMGIVARDEEGQVLLTAWQVLRRCASPEEAEAEACLCGIRLAAEWIGKPTQMEADCVGLINAIEATQESRSYWDVIIHEIKGVSRLLRQCEFKIQIRQEGSERRRA